MTYREMSAPEMLEALGQDASKWADAFLEINPGVADHGTMLGWFANAMCNQLDVQRRAHFQSDEAFADYCEDVMFHRRFAREVAGRPGSEAYTAEDGRLDSPGINPSTLPKEETR
jgi:hypothetical protein